MTTPRQCHPANCHQLWSVHGAVARRQIGDTIHDTASLLAYQRRARGREKRYKGVEAKVTRHTHRDSYTRQSKSGQIYSLSFSVNTATMVIASMIFEEGKSPILKKVGLLV